MVVVFFPRSSDRERQRSPPFVDAERHTIHCSYLVAEDLEEIAHLDDWLIQNQLLRRFSKFARNLFHEFFVAGIIGIRVIPQQSGIPFYSKKERKNALTRGCLAAQTKYSNQDVNFQIFFRRRIRVER